MSDENKIDWGEVALVLTCVIAGAGITVGFIYLVAMIQIHT
jgi:hypothetical protein